MNPITHVDRTEQLVTTITERMTTLARNPLSPQQKLGAVVGVIAGLVFVALGTWGPYENVWIDGMVPVNIAGGALTVISTILLVRGPARRKR